MPIEVVDKEIEDMRARYEDALHAVQTGIAMLIEIGDKLASPKSLRTGIDSAHVTDLAMANLLINKGIITKREYHGAVTEAMEAEKRSFEARLTVKIGKKVTLL